MVRVASVPQSTTATDCVVTRSGRFWWRSVTSPPSGPNSSIGPNCSAAVTPTAVTLPVSSNTSQSIAMRCIHDEVLAIDWAMT